jgi:TonB C terminal
MDSPQKMDVVDWRDSPPPVTVKKRSGRRFLSPSLIGIFSTVVLHALVIQSVPFGSWSPKAKPPEIQESANALKSKTDSAEGLVLITLPTMAYSIQTAPQNLVSSLPDLRKIKIKSPTDVDPPGLPNFEALALSEDQSSRPTSGNGDDTEQARLFGIYTGQIQARIDRVWRRPRTPINESTAEKKPTSADESFQCEAQIVQDARGNVQEIMLPRCNGSAAWRRSLVLAIQQSSPLPAPPSAKIFQYSITLSFVGLQYGSGEPEEDYEFEPRKIVQSN